MAEYKQLTLNPPEGIIAGPIDEENFFEWEALITGELLDCFHHSSYIKFCPKSAIILSFLLLIGI